MRRQHSNASPDDECTESKKSPSDAAPAVAASVSGDESTSFAQERVTLEALENTKVAVAQFAAIALAKGADENAIRDLSLLQSTLFTLQHQQVVQLQLIQKLQSQIESTNKKAKPTKKSKSASSSAPKSVDGVKESENRKRANVTPTPPPSQRPAAEQNG